MAASDIFVLGVMGVFVLCIGWISIHSKKQDKPNSDE